MASPYRFYGIGGRGRTSFSPRGPEQDFLFGGGTPLSPEADYYYRDNPNALMGLILNALPTTGRGAVSQNYYNFVQNWLRSLYGEFEGQVPESPERSFADYFRQQRTRIPQEYAFQAGTSPFLRFTRFIRGR